jgi:hypothetical protein
MIYFKGEKCVDYKVKAMDLYIVIMCLQLLIYFYNQSKPDTGPMETVFIFIHTIQTPNRIISIELE